MPSSPPPALDLNIHVGCNNLISWIRSVIKTFGGERKAQEAARKLDLGGEVT